MAVKEDIAEIKAALEEAEQNPSRRNVRALHNLLAEKLRDNADLLGLSDEDIVALGGGTPKDEEEE